MPSRYSIFGWTLNDALNAVASVVSWSDRPEGSVVGEGDAGNVEAEAVATAHSSRSSVAHGAGSLLRLHVPHTSLCPAESSVHAFYHGGSGTEEAVVLTLKLLWLALATTLLLSVFKSGRQRRRTALMMAVSEAVALSGTWSSCLLQLGCIGGSRDCYLLLRGVPRFDVSFLSRRSIRRQQNRAGARDSISRPQVRTRDSLSQT